MSMKADALRGVRAMKTKAKRPTIRRRDVGLQCCEKDCGRPKIRTGDDVYVTMRVTVEDGRVSSWRGKRFNGHLSHVICPAPPSVGSA
jgi:hypothetical protein